MPLKHGHMNNSSWSLYEVELIVADYFSMLRTELWGRSYSKAEHRKALMPLLQNRSDGSVEFKHQNISAVLINFGQPYIKGYLPRFNYQKILEDAVLGYLAKNIGIEDDFRYFADQKVIKTAVVPVDFEAILVQPPIIQNVVRESIPTYHRNPIRVNYLKREQQNHSIGELGEEMVLNYERWYLIQHGKEKLAQQVRWIAKEEGDGSGFDILSKSLSGKEKYIEVKTTKLGKETPFYFSRNELYFSQRHTSDYFLYRLFNFNFDSRMFTLNGSLDKICKSEPIQFEGRFT